MPKPTRIPLLTRAVPDRFRDFVRHVQGCRACPRMEGRKRVFTIANGVPNPPSGVMFIAEAPGRNGADRTGIPLHGDPSGVMFERMLSLAGWTRADVFVTNCVLCNPRDESGNNDAPSDEELTNCSFNLEQTIRMVDPRVIVTLGAKALQALNLIERHDYTLSGSVGKQLRWWHRTVVPLYHPSPRAMLHRSMKQQEADFADLKGIANAHATPW